MNQYPGINIKIELIKDATTSDLAFIIHFNPQSPNFSASQQNIRWKPTKEEQSFLLDTFSLIRNNTTDEIPFQSTEQMKTNLEPPEISSMDQTINQAIERQTNQENPQYNTQKKIEHIINKNRTP